jgi:hypothetical protein
VDLTFLLTDGKLTKETQLPLITEIVKDNKEYLVYEISGFFGLFGFEASLRVYTLVYTFLNLTNVKRQHTY